MKNYLLLLLTLLASFPISSQVNLVLDINDGSGNSSPDNFFVYEGKVYFAGDDASGVNSGGSDLGKELWVTDGTAAGTKLVKDLRTGDGSSTPNFFFEFSGTMYFSANTGSGNVLFSSDGTEAGTAATGGDFIFNPTELGGLIYYVNTTDGNSLYQFDGITQQPVANVNTGTSAALIGGNFIALGNKLLCYMDYSPDEVTIGRELYEYDPVADVFTLIKDITEDDGDSGISNFVSLGDEIYFEAESALWVTDGTTDGTVAVAAASSIGSVNNFYAWNDLLFFEGDDGSGDQLWKYDPVMDMATNLSAIAGSNTNHDPSDYAPLDNFLYYRGEDGDDTDGHLWRTDGTIVQQINNTIADVMLLWYWENNYFSKGIMDHWVMNFISSLL